MQKANERHGRRTNANEIRQMWLNNRSNRIKPIYKNLLSDNLSPMKPTEVQDVSEISNIIGNIAQKDKTLFAHGFVSIEAVSQIRTYASTDIAGKIYINFATDSKGFNAGANLVSAFSKLKAGVTLSEYEEYAIEVLWHEILHNMSKNKTFLPELSDIEFGYKRMLMETVNQLVARHTYDRFISKFWGKAIHKEWVLTQGHGYNETVNNLRFLLKEAKIDELKFVKQAEKDLMQDYRFFDQNIKNTLVKLYKGKGDIAEVINYIESKDIEFFIQSRNIRP